MVDKFFSKKSVERVAQAPAYILDKTVTSSQKIGELTVNKPARNAKKYWQSLGPVPLPTEILKYTVNRSTFVHKNAREQFEMRVHKRIIDVMSPNEEIIEALRDLNLPSGVDIGIA
jgi:small subunit ribosomal protein S10